MAEHAIETLFFNKRLTRIATNECFICHVQFAAMTFMPRCLYYVKNNV